MKRVKLKFFILLFLYVPHTISQDVATDSSVSIVSPSSGATIPGNKVSVSNLHISTITMASKVANYFILTNKARELNWNWGPGVFLYGLARLADATPISEDREKYKTYISDYHHYYNENSTPEINWADLCTPALSGYLLYKKLGDSSGLLNTAKVIDYISKSERNAVGSLDHLGTQTFWGFVYPDSIWIDSLMMWGVLSVLWGIKENDHALYDFGVEQSLIFSQRLQHPTIGLYYHAYNIDKRQTIPKSAAFWLRGNGWAMTNFSEILELMPLHDKRRDKIIENFKKLTDALIKFQMESGLWDTVVDMPGYSYEEFSGSALVAYGIAKGVRIGVLPVNYLKYAIKTFSAITMRLGKRGENYMMRQVSGPTIPGNALFYSIIPLLDNKDYGVGAYILLGVELYVIQSRLF